MESNNRIHRHSAPEDKIALFRSFFRGREDVYPRRFESRKTGKAGYSPVCANEWVRGICEKPKIKCAECPHRQFLPVTDDVIRWHLSGQDDNGWDFTMGVYPMLLDETCFSCGRFRQGNMAGGCEGISRNLSAMNLARGAGKISLRQWRTHLVVLQRSHSGHACSQAWFAYPDRDDGAPADIGLDSYDRFFPEPRYAAPRRLRQLDSVAASKKNQGMLGNSVFLDDNLSPYQDQWAFLS